MSTIPLSVLELLKCELEPNALRRDFPAKPNSRNNQSYIFVRQTANSPTVFDGARYLRSDPRRYAHGVVLGRSLSVC